MHDQFGAEHSRLKKVEFSTTAHLPFHGLEFRDLAFGLTIGPRRVDCGVYGGLVLDDPVGE
jgi:hypothetical protein